MTQADRAHHRCHGVCQSSLRLLLSLLNSWTYAVVLNKEVWRAASLPKPLHRVSPVISWLNSTSSATRVSWLCGQRTVCRRMSNHALVVLLSLFLTLYVAIGNDQKTPARRRGFLVVKGHHRGRASAPCRRCCPWADCSCASPPLCLNGNFVVVLVAADGFEPPTFGL